MTRRLLTLPGVTPVGPMQWKFEAFYPYGAVAPLTGESFFLELPYFAIPFWVFSGMTLAYKNSKREEEPVLR